MNVYVRIAIGLVISVVAVPAIAGSWANNVKQLIAAEQKYPRSAVVRGTQGTTRIRIHIAEDGTISNVDLITNSGSEILDREALRMPTKVGKVPPPPSGKKQAIILPVTFRLEEG